LDFWEDLREKWAKREKIKKIWGTKGTNISASATNVF
jgi:hypothetical protein